MRRKQEIDTQEKLENAVLAALDQAVLELYGIERQGWRDEDLSSILPWIKRHAKTIDQRYDTAYGEPV